MIPLLLVFSLVIVSGEFHFNLKLFKLCLASVICMLTYLLGGFHDLLPQDTRRYRSCLTLLRVQFGFVRNRIRFNMETATIPDWTIGS